MYMSSCIHVCTKLHVTGWIVRWWIMDNDLFTFAPFHYRSDDQDRYTFVLAAGNLSSNLRGEREQSVSLAHL